MAEVIPMIGGFAPDLSYSRQDINQSFDSTILPKNTTKVETWGKLRKRRMLIMCLGNDKFKVREIKRMKDKLKELKKLLKDGTISQEEYDEYRKAVLDDEYK